MRSEAIVPLASVLDIVPLETLRTLALAASALLVAAALAGAVAAWMSAMRVHLPTSSRRPSGELSWNLDPLHVPQIVAARDQLPRLIQDVAPGLAQVQHTGRAPSPDTMDLRGGGNMRNIGHPQAIRDGW